MSMRSTAAAALAEADGSTTTGDGVAVAGAGEGVTGDATLDAGVGVGPGALAHPRRTKARRGPTRSRSRFLIRPTGPAGPRARRRDPAARHHRARARRRSS